MTHNQLVRTLQLVNHIMTLLAIWYVWTTGELWWLAVSVCFWLFTGILGINVGMHRLISHRSFETPIWIERTLMIISVLTTVGSPLAWTAVHRQHHRHCETDRDPHSPHAIGAFRAWFGLWSLDHLDARLVRDLRRDRFQRSIHRYYGAIILGWVVCLTLIDPILVVFCYAVPATMVLHSTSSIIVLAHCHGYRTYDLGHDLSRNSWLANLLTVGEGWHNNHHAHPQRWKQGERWWEIDPPSWVIRLIRSN